MIKLDCVKSIVITRNPESLGTTKESLIKQSRKLFAFTAETPRSQRGNRF
jgi:hypothetical protein